MAVDFLMVSFSAPYYRYDPRVNRWSYVAPMTVKRKHLGVAVVDNSLYAVGGRDDNYELSSVER